MTVGELLGRISSKELTEWHAYFALKHEDAEWEVQKQGQQ
jgi:hypothetical protein